MSLLDQLAKRIEECGTQQDARRLVAAALAECFNENKLDEVDIEAFRVMGEILKE